MVQCYWPRSGAATTSGNLAAIKPASGAARSRADFDHNIIGSPVTTNGNNETALGVLAAKSAMG